MSRYERKKRTKELTSLDRFELNLAGNLAVRIQVFSVDRGSVLDRISDDSPTNRNLFITPREEESDRLTSSSSIL